MSVLRQAEGERRRHVRRPASGPVTLWWTEWVRRKIEGRLVDISESGFRMAHGCAELSSGQEVHFEHAGGEGMARTVWTRISAESVETGLIVLSNSLTDETAAGAWCAGRVPGNREL
jgi:hypothetical protein